LNKKIERLKGEKVMKTNDLLFLCSFITNDLQIVHIYTNEYIDILYYNQYDVFTFGNDDIKEVDTNDDIISFISKYDDISYVQKTKLFNELMEF
jgi:hypothetical protein